MSNNKLVVYGCGRMAETYSSFLQQNFEICAYTVTQELCVNDKINNLPLVPFEEIEKKYPPSEYNMLIAVGYIEMNDVREKISQKVIDMGYSLVSYVSTDLMLHTNVSFGKNTVIFDKCSIHTNCEIGNNVFISSGVHIGHDCIIEDNVWINSGVVIAGGVTIKQNCFLGINSSIAHDVILNNHVYVGANTLVTKSIDEYQVITSDPGQVFLFNSKRYLKMAKVTASV